MYLQYFQKNVGDEADFLSAVKHKTILQAHGITLVGHTQSTQNSKFAISLQYLKKNMKDEVDCLSADKHQRFLQVDTIILGVSGQAYPNYSK